MELLNLYTKFTMYSYLNDYQSRGIRQSRVIGQNVLEPLSSRERLQREPLTLTLCIPFAEGKKVSNPGTDFGSLLRVKKREGYIFP